MIKRNWKSVIYTAAALAGVTVFAGVLLPSFVSSSLVRNAIEQELADFTGREVTLQGAIELDLFPRPVAHLDNVIIASDVADEAPFLRVESINADISALTLLSRKPQFTGFELVRPSLTLIRSKSGEVNWNHGFARLRDAKTMAKRNISTNQQNIDSEKLTPSQMLDANFPKRLGYVKVTNGTLHLLNEDGQAALETTSINGMVDWPAIDASLRIDATGVIRGTPLSIQFSTSTPLALLANQPSTTELAVKSDIASMTYSGALGVYQDYFADGALSLNIASMSAFLDFIQADISPGSVVKSITLKSDVKVSGEKASFENVALTIDKNFGAGVLEISTSPDKGPLIAGTLDFQSLDMASFLDAFITLPTDEISAQKDIDLSFISQLRTDLRISAATANFGGILFTQAAATAQISERAAIFDLGDAIAYGGELQARLQVLTNEDGQKNAQLSVAGKEINTSDARNALQLPVIFPTGIATGSIDVTAPVSSWSQMAQEANGKLSLKMDTGTTLGFGVQRLLSQNGDDNFFRLTDDSTITEKFNALSFEGKLADGVVTIETGDITYPMGKVQFEGVAPYRSGGIALTAIAKPNEPSPENVERRFFIGGSWDRAFATPLIRNPPK